MFAAKNELFTTPSGYQIQRSLRFRSSASANLSKTFSSAPTSRTTITQSAWVKLGALSNAYNIIALFGTFNNWEQISLTSPNNTNGWAGNVIRITGPGSAGELRTTQVFRDPAAWYHIVVVYDTTNATSSERIRLFINGVRVTSFSTATYPPQNQTTTEWLVSGAESNIATTGASTTQTFDGYMTEINVIDGQALTPSSFGAINPVTGVWSATRYNGTYGTNGFYLNFTDNSAATATTIGKDYSGNGNNWTPNNISVTAGATYDSMLDAPLGAGGGERGNYCVMNPLKAGSGSLLSQGNLAWTYSSGSASATPATFSISSGKWYHEVTITSANINHLSGWADATNSVYVDIFNIGATNGIEKSSGTTSGSSFTFANNDILGIAFDYDNATITFYKNNTSQFSVSAITLSGALMSPIQGIGSSGGGASSCVYNFGQRPFSYTPPTGFKALHTGNLAAPVIALPAQNMAATTYTGTGATQSISNAVNSVSMQPDWVWFKRRGAAENHWLTDSVRGSTKGLFSNLTDAEATRTDQLTSFNSNGFTLGADAAGYSNVSGQSYVAWQWKAGGTAVTNTAGSITSSVSANTTAGFSVVTWATNATSGNATIGHGLGVAPTMIFMKDRSFAYSWDVYQANVCTGGNYRLILNTTAALDTGNNPFGGVVPTSSVFTMNQTFYARSGDNIVAYCFAPVAGYSAFGSYTGNASTDGPFVYLGFRPKFVVVKLTSSSGQAWYMSDSSRSPNNVVQTLLEANSSSAEFDTGASLDYLSNGFKIRESGTGFNGSGSTYIYMAFAENPFKNSLAR